MEGVDEPLPMPWSTKQQALQAFLDPLLLARMKEKRNSFKAFRVKLVEELKLCTVVGTVEQVPVLHVFYSDTDDCSLENQTKSLLPGTPQTAVGFLLDKWCSGDGAPVENGSNMGALRLLTKELRTALAFRDHFDYDADKHTLRRKAESVPSGQNAIVAAMDRKKKRKLSEQGPDASAGAGASTDPTDKKDLVTAGDGLSPQKFKELELKCLGIADSFEGLQGALSTGGLSVGNIVGVGSSGTGKTAFLCALSIFIAQQEERSVRLWMQKGRIVFQKHNVPFDLRMDEGQVLNMDVVLDALKRDPYELNDAKLLRDMGALKLLQAVPGFQVQSIFDASPLNAVEVLDKVNRGADVAPVVFLEDVNMEDPESKTSFLGTPGVVNRMQGGYLNENTFIVHMNECEDMRKIVGGIQRNPFDDYKVVSFVILCNGLLSLGYLKRYGGDHDDPDTLLGRARRDVGDNDYFAITARACDGRAGDSTLIKHSALFYSSHDRKFVFVKKTAAAVYAEQANPRSAANQEAGDEFELLDLLASKGGLGR
jgi:hypothetical protein